MAYYKADMLSIKARSTLAQLLAEIVLLSETVESYRQSLAQVPYFDCIGLFRWLDRQEKGYLSERDWQAVIGTKHRKLLTYAFSWFDNMKVGEVSRLEFASFLLPKDNLELRQLVAGRVEKPEMVVGQKEHILAQFDIFRQLNLQIMKREMKMIELRRALMQDRDYSIEGVLKAMDGHSHGWLCVQDLRVFMQNYGFDATQRQVQKLTEIINYSLDGKITIAQMKWTVEGLQGSDKAYLRKIKASNKKEPPRKPIDFQTSFAQHKHKQSQPTILPPTPSQIQYQGIMGKLKQAEEEQKKADAQLIHYEQESKVSARRQYHRQMERLQARKAAEEAARAKERQEVLAKRAMNEELETIITRTNQLQAESERLARLENRLQIQEDTYHLRQTTKDIEYLNAYASGVKPITAPVFSPTTYEITPLSAAADINTYSHFNQYRSMDFESRIENSDAYLTAARQLRQKIKRERDVERSIREQFSSGQYASRSLYNSKTQSKTPGSILVKTAEAKKQLSSHKEKGGLDSEYMTARREMTVEKGGVDTTLKLPASSGKKT